MDEREEVYLELKVTGRWPINQLIQGWTQDEKKDLFAGDEDAMDALKQEALTYTMRSPEAVDEDYIKVTLGV